ncbi:unnamed protein product [Schistosoma mattheei]|uniref:Uncharacterized protein n=1 Tax=Schistosoma mattheei TaxID=31246 RepID=A0A183PGT6_9TREM|nr:unnamed protein product [Schistosoma mattheei]
MNRIVIRGSRQETLNPGFVLFGTRQQVVPVILRELVFPYGFDTVSPSFTVKDITTELSGPTSCRIESVREHQFPQNYRYTLMKSAK